MPIWDTVAIWDAVAISLFFASQSMCGLVVKQCAALEDVTGEPSRSHAIPRVALTVAAHFRRRNEIPSY